jgi:hypothetical protein
MFYKVPVYTLTFVIGLPYTHDRIATYVEQVGLY